MLLAALRLELVDLGLHRGEGLFDRGQGLQNLALGRRGGLALFRLEPRTIHHVAVLLLCRGELLAQPADRRFGGRQLRRDLGARLGLLRSQLGDQLGVAGFDDSRIGIHLCAGTTRSRHQNADEGAQDDADGEADQEGDDGIHGAQCRNRVRQSRVGGPRVRGLGATAHQNVPEMSGA